MRILIVDDNPDNLKFLRLILSNGGYQVKTAPDGKEALEAARRHPPHLVISDILMPVMDGFALCRAWHEDEALKNIPFIFYTATYTSDEDERFALSLGARAFIRKPADPLAFLAELEEVLNGSDLPANGPTGPLEAMPREDFLQLYSERLVRKLEARSERLYRSEERYRRLFEGNRDAIFLADPETGVLMDANPAACALAGRAREELVGQPQTLLHPAGEAGRYRRIFMEAVQSGGGEPITGLFVEQATGRLVPVEITASLVETGDGRVLMGLFRDLTERLGAEEALRESEKRFRLMFDQAPVCYQSLDQEGRFLEVNQTWLDTLGYAREEVVGRHFTEFMSPASAALMPERFACFMTSGEIHGYEFELAKKNGSVILVSYEGRIARDAKGAFVRTHCMFFDITEKRKAEESRRLLTTAIEQSHETVLVTDRDGTIVYVNPAFERITGYSKDEAIGQTPRLLKSGVHDRSFYEDLWTTLLSGAVWSGRVINRKKDGSLYTEQSAVSPVRDASGAIVAFVAVKRDITDDLALQERLARAEKLETIGLIAGGVAHEVRNPLFSIITIVTALERKLKDQPEFGEYVMHIKDQSERLNRLMNDLLTLGRPIIREEFRPCLVRDIAVKSLDRIGVAAPGASARCALHLPEEALFILGIPDKLEQVFFNLIHNALEFSPGGEPLDVQIWSQGPSVCFSLSDRGPGIPEALLPKLFQPFASKRKGGTGLGLAIVQTIVHAHGGTVEAANNDPGPGATFTVRLPMASKKSSEGPGVGE